MVRTGWLLVFVLGVLMLFKGMAMFSNIIMVKKWVIDMSIFSKPKSDLSEEEIRIVSSFGCSEPGRYMLNRVSAEKYRECHELLESWCDMNTKAAMLRVLTDQSYFDKDWKSLSCDDSSAVLAFNNGDTPGAYVLKYITIEEYRKGHAMWFKGHRKKELERRKIKARIRYDEECRKVRMRRKDIVEGGLYYDIFNYPGRKVECACGSCVFRHGFLRHLITGKHVEWERKNNLPSYIDDSEELDLAGDWESEWDAELGIEHRAKLRARGCVSENVEVRNVAQPIKPQPHRSDEFTKTYAAIKAQHIKEYRDTQRPEQESEYDSAMAYIKANLIDF